MKWVVNTQNTISAWLIVVVVLFCLLREGIDKGVEDEELEEGGGGSPSHSMKLGFWAYSLQCLKSGPIGYPCLYNLCVVFGHLGNDWAIR